MVEEIVKRMLTAILSADAVGYSSHMDEDEAMCTTIEFPFAGWICNVRVSYCLAFLLLASIPVILIAFFLLTPPRTVRSNRM